jgi:hypothetical protein
MIVIPMAGRSSRFFKVGFSQPKYMLALGPRHGGATVFRLCIDSFKAYFTSETFVFVHLDEPGVRAFLDHELAAAGIAAQSCRFVALPGATSGQAETVALGLEQAGMPGDDPLIIFNIDTIRPGYRKPAFLADPDVTGYLEVVRAAGDHWSFALADASGRVVEVAEKRRISDLCSTGLYHFRRAQDFMSAFRATLSMAASDLSGGERYVAPLYNSLIRDGADIRFDLITMDQVQFSGTPDEYHTLLRS